MLVAGVEPRTVLVTASARDFHATDSIRLYPARPARLVLSANRVSAIADGSSTINLTVELFRAPGQGAVSLKTPVTLLAFDNMGEEVRALRRTGASGENGVVALTLSSISPGTFRMIAMTDGIVAPVSDTIALTFRTQ
jgi:hypothetical protein